MYRLSRMEKSGERTAKNGRNQTWQRWVPDWKDLPSTSQIHCQEGRRHRERNHWTIFLVVSYRNLVFVFVSSWTVYITTANTWVSGLFKLPTASRQVVYTQISKKKRVRKRGLQKPSWSKLALIKSREITSLSVQSHYTTGLTTKHTSLINPLMSK